MQDKNQLLKGDYGAEQPWRSHRGAEKPKRVDSAAGSAPVPGASAIVSQPKNTLGLLPMHPSGG